MISQETVTLDPPQSPLKRGTLTLKPPFLGVAALKELGGWGIECKKFAIY
jgi:hypothetical protein